MSFWNFLICFYIGTELTKPCLASRARKLVLFCFYYSTTAIADDIVTVNTKLK